MTRDEFIPEFGVLVDYFKEMITKAMIATYFRELNVVHVGTFKIVCNQLMRAKRPNKMNFPTTAELVTLVREEWRFSENKAFKQGFENNLYEDGGKPMTEEQKKEWRLHDGFQKALRNDDLKWIMNAKPLLRDLFNPDWRGEGG